MPHDRQPPVMALPTLSDIDTAFEGMAQILIRLRGRLAGSHGAVAEVDDALAAMRRAQLTFEVRARQVRS